MRIKRWAGWVLAGLAGLTTALAGPPAQAADAAADPPGERLKLSVLYVGQPETPRTQDFVAFLGQHFTKVGQADVSVFRQEQVQGYDAVIVDCGPVDVKNNTIVMSKVQFTPTYSRPTVMVGATAALVSSRLGLKTGYI